MIPDDKLREIRESVNLVALISEYVPLRLQGGRYVGLCPFHSEKTPSFGVSRGKDFFYCFGCQAAGDAFKFLRHVEGLGFMEAVEKLAERSGIEVPHTDDPGQLAMIKQRARRERLAELMLLAQTFFERQLWAPEATIAQEELTRRHITRDSAAAFHLGYAPASWDALARHFTDKRVDLDEAVEVGLLQPKKGGPGFIDAFRHRLMFPVADQQGRIIAFSGRDLPVPPGTPERPPTPKYKNSPESPLYKKRFALFGLSTAKVAMRKQNKVLLCEGNFDLVSIHQAGFENVVAPLGTSFTSDQAKLIRRFVEEVIVAFDGDAAGRSATEKSFELLYDAGLKARAVRLPAGADPDSFLREHGADAFRALVEGAPTLLDFIVDQARERLRDSGDKAAAIQDLAQHWSKLADPIEQAHFVERVAQKFDVRSHEALRASLRRAALQKTSAMRKGGDSPRRADMGGAARTSAPSPEKAPIRMRRANELPRRQCDVLELLLAQPLLLGSDEAARLAELLTDSDLQAIFSTTARMFAQRGDVDAPALLAELSDNGAQAWLAERLERGRGGPEIDLDQARQQLSDALPWLERDFRNLRREEIKREIQIANQTGNKARVLELTRLRDELART